MSQDAEILASEGSETDQSNGNNTGNEQKPELYKSGILLNGFVELCDKFTQTGFCKYGDRCQFAHGIKEVRYVPKHPKYKTQKCKSYWKTGSCRYGNRCTFKHGESSEEFLNSFSDNPRTKETKPIINTSQPQNPVFIDPYYNTYKDFQQPIYSYGADEFYSPINNFSNQQFFYNQIQMQNNFIRKTSFDPPPISPLSELSEEDRKKTWPMSLPAADSLVESFAHMQLSEDGFSSEVNQIKLASDSEGINDFKDSNEKRLPVFMQLSHPPANCSK